MKNRIGPAIAAAVLATVVMVVSAAVRGGSSETVTVDLAMLSTETTGRWGEPLSSAASDEDEAETPANAPASGPATTARGSTATGDAGREDDAGPDEDEIIEVDEGTESDPGPGDLAPGEYPISSNASEGYPLETLVDPAVALLRAEMTGEGSDAYPHLAGRVTAACCTDLVVNGAAVLFAEVEGDPARVVVDWEATERVGGGTRYEVTESRWWWVDGAWVPEHERE